MHASMSRKHSCWLQNWRHRSVGVEKWVMHAILLVFRIKIHRYPEIMTRPWRHRGVSKPVPHIWHMKCFKLVQIGSANIKSVFKCVWPFKEAIQNEITSVIQLGARPFHIFLTGTLLNHQEHFWVWWLIKSEWLHSNVRLHWGANQISFALLITPKG